MGKRLDGDQYRNIHGKLLEIQRQMRQRDGYPYDPDALEHGLQRLIEGGFPPRQWIQTRGIGDEKCHLLSIPVIDHGPMNWIEDLGRSGIKISEFGASSMINSADFPDTNREGIPPYPRWVNLTIHPPVSLGERLSSERAIEIAKRLELTPPERLSPCVAVALRLHLCSSDIHALGYKALVVFHDQIRGATAEPELFCLESVEGKTILGSRFVKRSGGYWPKDHGLVFGGHIND